MPVRNPERQLEDVSDARVAVAALRHPFQVHGDPGARNLNLPLVVPFQAGRRVLVGRAGRQGESQR
jgi:hypothetical protein